MFIPHDPNGLFPDRKKPIEGIVTGFLNTQPEAHIVLEFDGQKWAISVSEWDQRLQAYDIKEECLEHCRCMHDYYRKMRGHKQT